MVFYDLAQLLIAALEKVVVAIIFLLLTLPLARRLRSLLRLVLPVVFVGRRLSSHRHLPFCNAARVGRAFDDWKWFSFGGSD